MTKRIDSHHHLWKVERGDYHWMPDDGPLHHDYLPEDLKPQLDAAKIDGTILVQAAMTVAETEWLLQLANRPDSFVYGVCGWVPLDTDDAVKHLEWFAQQQKAVSVRPMLQDLPEDDWIAQPTVVENLKRLPALGMRFEVLSFPPQLPHAFRALEQVPDVPVLINHLSKPTYRHMQPEWQQWMRAFAGRENAYCKISGMVTEVGPDWQTDDFRAHVDFVLEHFGPRRIMFGSDWPVCRLAAEYHQVITLADTLTASLDDTQQAAFWGGNAAAFYAIDTGDGS